MKYMLTYPLPIVAAINGHAYAGGAMLSFCCDFRIMNASKGFLCVNEMSIGLPLTPGAKHLLARLTNSYNEYPRNGGGCHKQVSKVELERILFCKSILRV
eukprot:Trichotokara_eunicae@DN4135_c0_g1_i2.p1